MLFPPQMPSVRAPSEGVSTQSDAFDARRYLEPSRLTIAMWDQAFLLRHGPGDVYANYPRVLGDLVERGYNTVRIDPMPQWIDLANPDRILSWPDPKLAYMPWGWDRDVTGPAGAWLIEFMTALRDEPDLHYTLSAWWFCNQNPQLQGPPPLHTPTTHVEVAEVWCEFLTKWRRRFGFDGLAYVDLANEIPFFVPGYLDRIKSVTGTAWHESPGRFTDAQIQFLAEDLNGAMKLLHGEFPELRFTGSIHGDLRWLDVPLQFDCLDVHFYADADPRWADRTKFPQIGDRMFNGQEWHADFSRRCNAAHRAAAPMFRAAQRDKLMQFADWSRRRGMPLTTSESWSSWYYYDSPDLDWHWLLEWAAWSVEDAIDAKMWGWTPHNYVQPQFENWNDIAWHQRLTQRFIES